MPVRTVSVDGTRWEVQPSGRVTPNDRDEFALIFTTGSGVERQSRIVRYSPMGARWREQSMAEMSEADLRRLFEMSQPSFTSPEVGYQR